MLFKKNDEKIKLEEEKEEKTVLKIKTVDDIPVIKEMRKYIGNNDIKNAIIYGYINVKKDYTRFFNADNYSSNRLFIINELKKVNVDIGINDSYTDNVAIKNAIEKQDTKIGKNNDIKDDSNVDNDIKEESNENNNKNNMRYYAIKKIALYYFNYYEIARFGYMEYNKIDADEILNKIKDIYNYMDIMKLFYNDQDDNLN